MTNASIYYKRISTSLQEKALLDKLHKARKDRRLVPLHVKNIKTQYDAENTVDSQNLRDFFDIFAKHYNQGLDHFLPIWSKEVDGRNCGDYFLDEGFRHYVIEESKRTGIYASEFQQKSPFHSQLLKASLPITLARTLSKIEEKLAGQKDIKEGEIKNFFDQFKSIYKLIVYQESTHISESILTYKINSQSIRSLLKNKLIETFIIENKKHGGFDEIGIRTWLQMLTEPVEASSPSAGGAAAATPETEQPSELTTAPKDTMQQDSITKDSIARDLKNIKEGWDQNTTESGLLEKFFDTYENVRTQTTLTESLNYKGALFIYKSAKFKAFLKEAHAKYLTEHGIKDVKKVVIAFKILLTERV